ncbi:uncharacterized protein PITG_09737 [Phytophthora infestans T30-4]|uniref:Uncharacterized protein n=1 Tax=Phytophthora infestans (strain T30-4) TaxID=403677 RepID=D0NCP3_PHYIT|nr:uncharacterized protein PITG_09737 [Phytophthora infestans T30-4]EEY55757.1 hypothetical protein PITG_09737 [Phytophthora infestans T30-4]|eukprot:XP_002903333.1 hypothetical protein PITG_09737 [Phytophthora infestans T30-4]
MAVKLSPLHTERVKLKVCQNVSKVGSVSPVGVGVNSANTERRRVPRWLVFRSCVPPRHIGNPTGDSEGAAHAGDQE